MVKLGISVPPHSSFCRKTCSSVAAVECARGQEHNAFSTTSIAASSICRQTCTISKSQGGFPSRASLGVHSNDDKQDLGGLVASICRPTKAVKKPQEMQDTKPVSDVVPQHWSPTS